MGYSKKYTGLKLATTNAATAATSGVTTIASTSTNTTYFSSPVPVKGATGIVFTLKSTDANALQAAGGSESRVSHDLAGTGNLSGSSYVTLKGGGASAMNTTGLRVIFVPTYGTPAKWMGADFLSVGFTTHASIAHTNVTCDAEVFYDAEADFALAAYGQGGLTVPA